MNDLSLGAKFSVDPEHAKDHPPVKFGKTGVLIVNLGTPDGTDYWSMRRYLHEFLSDRRVIEVNRVVWWFLLNVVILSKRPFSSGEAYESIWDHERGESPLRTITRSQADKIAAQFAAHHEIVVDWAMRYGNPSIEIGIDRLMREGCERILLFPLYPQYAAATTATVCDKTFDVLKKKRWQPTLRVAPPYHDHPLYVEALANSITSFLGTLEWEPEVILASFHGIPKEYFDKGDPYHCHCQKTARLLRERLGMSEDYLRLTFQSRFGDAEWLQPYTDKTVEALAESGVKRLAVVTPGFASDCVETLEEIAGENGDIFKEHGGEKFTLIPCLNDNEDSIKMLTTIIKNELKGWVET